jgi:hypothetical protein
MTDRGTIFSAPMVCALHSGSKTQTRRIFSRARVFATPERRAFTLQGEHMKRALQGASGFRHLMDDGWYWEADAFDYQAPATRTGWMAHIGYAAGDRLWVREEWASTPAYDDLKPADMGGDEPVYYPADGATLNWASADGKTRGRRRAGRHMPRWASRTTLIIEDVKVERLQEISEADAIAEGVILRHAGSSPLVGYETLWNLLHGNAGERWDDNPFVVAVTFRVVRGNIDQVPGVTGGSCIAPRCTESVSGRRRLCDAHWKALPSKLRSQLSMSARFPRSSVTDELWQKAKIALASEEKRA